MLNYKEAADLGDPALAVYSKLSEAQLKHYYEPEPGLFICESPKVIRRALDAGYEPVSLLFEPKYLTNEDRDILERVGKKLSQAVLTGDPSSRGEGAVGSTPDIPAYMMSSENMSRLTGYPLTCGMLCAMKRKARPSVEDLLSEICACKNNAHDDVLFRAGNPENTGSKKPTVRVAVLDNIENPTNIGAIFRSAAAMNIDTVLLTEDCSDPLYRRSARVSVGTVFQIPWTFASESKHNSDKTASQNVRVFSGGADYIDLLHKLGFQIAALALKEDSLSIDDPKLKQIDKLAIILGNEGDGLHPEALAACDFVVKIPMAEGIDSLNVAAASAVAFWELR